MYRPSFERHDLSSRRRVLAAGDVHGRFDLLSQLLDEMNFDAEQDTLVLLGDLVDRGPYNEAALDWCARPGILRVFGNHDWLTHRHADGCMAGRFIHLQNGGGWFNDIEGEAERKRWATVMADCPLAIEAATPRGFKVGFVHADVPTPTWTELETALETSPDLAETYGTAWDCMWSRDRAKKVRNRLRNHGTVDGSDLHVPGIDHVFFGHTIMPQATTAANCSWIDTGAFNSDILTVVDVDDWIIQHQSALAA